MLFDFETAISVRNAYKNILVGMELSSQSNLIIDGIFICHQGNIQKAINILMNSGFDDRYPLIGVTDEKTQRFEIYVYAYDGANFYYNELDKNLTEKGIEKTYPIEQKHQ